jgi:hypothetical protein
MIICSNCDKKIEKVNFCTPKCKVYYHRKHHNDNKPIVTKPKKQLIKPPKKIVKPIEKPKPTIEDKHQARLLRNMTENNYF